MAAGKEVIIWHGWRNAAGDGEGATFSGIEWLVERQSCIARGWLSFLVLFYSVRRHWSVADMAERTHSTT